MDSVGASVAEILADETDYPPLFELSDTRKLLGYVRTVTNEYSAITQAERNIVRRARTAGEALEAAKLIVGHGKFRMWRKETFPHISSRTLEAYHAVYTYCVEHPDKIAKLESITLSKALQQITTERRIAKSAVAADSKPDSTTVSDKGSTKTKPRTGPAARSRKDSDIGLGISNCIYNLGKAVDGYSPDRWRVTADDVQREHLRRFARSIIEFLGEAERGL